MIRVPPLTSNFLTSYSSSSSSARKSSMESSGGSGAFLVKQLASCSQSSRERTLRIILKTWLPTQPAVTDDEMKKLWKALFYCVWHADKASYQSHLIGRLSSLLLSLDSPLSLVYFRGFLLTLRREWPGIDSLRLDKFYLLVRRFLSALFELFAAHGWDLEFMTGFLDAVFCRGGVFEGNGVNYHIAAVYVEEIRRFLPVSRDVLERVAVVPFLGLLGSSSDKVLVRKVKSNMFDVFLRNGREFLDAKRSGVEVDPSGDVAVYGAIGLKMGFAARFYELGSSPDCCQGNRKFLLSLHEEFSRLEKELRSSGVEVTMLESVAPDCEEEVPELIPMNGFSDNASESKTKKTEKSKKNKKKKKAGNSSEDIVVSGADDSPSNDRVADLLLDGSVLSNLKLQFEKVAAEADTNKDSTLYDSPKVTIVCNGDSLKKRKRANKLSASKNKSAGPRGNVEELYEKSVGSSVKKVRFEMTNNLVWKPHTPLPPQDLRIPPSVTPRGSALKKGLSPGPIMETLTQMKKRKQRSKNGKVVRKAAKSVSPAVKQLKKMNSRYL